MTWSLVIRRYRIDAAKDGPESAKLVIYRHMQGEWAIWSDVLPCLQELEELRGFARDVIDIAQSGDADQSSIEATAISHGISTTRQPLSGADQ